MRSEILEKETLPPAKEAYQHSEAEPEACPSAWAWGCKGHHIVALIAEEHLNPQARAMVIQILAASANGPDLRRYCGDTGLDAFVDSSTWADDERSIRPDTAGWHFIDIPRGAPERRHRAILPARGGLRDERDHGPTGCASEYQRQRSSASRCAALRDSFRRRSAPAAAYDDER
jgi:S1/P1 Nuclease